MQVYQTDHHGIWTGQVVDSDPSPLQEGVFLIPGGCVQTPPPELGENQVARWLWDEERWEILTVVAASPDSESQT